MNNYYNEIDHYGAEWLLNLATAGEIPSGKIDTRSIKDVRPGDLTGFRQCHFFAGVAGWPLALKLAGWPDDKPVWSGSCPCQPFSVAGKRKGNADERHLWPEFYRLIAECLPPAIIGEQVASKDDRQVTTNIEFGKWLRERRLAVGLSQSKFADLLGENRSNICNMEKGRRDRWRSVAKLKLVTHLLGIEDDLASYEMLIAGSVLSVYNRGPATAELLRTITEYQLIRDDIEYLIIHIRQKFRKPADASIT